jgi:hypothetical protein
MVTGKKKTVICGFENYLINEKGDVYLLNYYYPAYDCYPVLSKRIDRGGYYTVRLHRGKKCYTKFLHRLLAEAFIPNPQDKGFVNHRDGDKLNNSLSNLEWSTHPENIFHAYSIGLVTKKKKQVIDSRTGLVYNDVKVAALNTGLNYLTLKSYLNGNRPNPTWLRYVD